MLAYFWLVLASLFYSIAPFHPAMDKEQPMTATEVVKIRPERPVLEPRAPPATKKDASWAPGDYIKPTMIRYPMYEYKTGTTFYLSKTQQIVVDAYLKTHNVTEACRTLNAIRAAHGTAKRSSINAVSRWLRKPMVALYIANSEVDRGKVNWLDQPKWEAWGIDVMNNKILATQVQVVVWKEFGKAKGWYKETGPQNMTNMQINFVQSDGKA